MPLLVAIGGAALLVLVAVGLARAIGVSVERAALAVSLLIGLVMTYGHVWNLVGESLRLHRYLLTVWALIAALGLVMIWRLAPAAVRRATVGLTVAIGALILVNLIPIADLAIRSVSVATSAEEGERGSAEHADGDDRDIWYIVPDRYAGSEGLQEVYGFDNTPFLDALEERGFEVAASATSSYLKTALSLLSTLNFEELDFEELEAEATGGDDFGPIHRRLQESHAVARYLHERGYRYLHVGSVRGPTAGNPDADEVFLYNSTTEFGSVLADTTLLRALERVAPDAFAPGLEELYSKQIEFQLHVLNDLADAPGLNFVFAHLLIPHPPYAFNADGSRVTDAQRASRTIEEQYLEHVRFTNASLLALVDRLHAGPPESWPIIVIAADEGPFPNRYTDDEDGFKWLEAQPEELLGKFSILSAISVPGVDRAGLEAAGFSDDMTLVNLFRIVFNAAFDAGLPMLPPRNWVFVDQRHIYDEVDVSDRIPT